MEGSPITKDKVISAMDKALEAIRKLPKNPFYTQTIHELEVAKTLVEKQAAPLPEFRQYDFSNVKLPLPNTLSEDEIENRKQEFMMDQARDHEERERSDYEEHNNLFKASRGY